MSRFPEPTDAEDWQPATSRPGELFTVEGQMRATGVFLRGLKQRDPRLKAYRRSMLRTALVFAVAAMLLGVSLAVIASLA